MTTSISAKNLSGFFSEWTPAGLFSAKQARGPFADFIVYSRRNSGWNPFFQAEVLFSFSGMKTKLVFSLFLCLSVHLSPCPTSGGVSLQTLSTLSGPFAPTPVLGACFGLPSTVPGVCEKIPGAGGNPVEKVTVIRWEFLHFCHSSPTLPASAPVPFLLGN